MFQNDSFVPFDQYNFTYTPIDLLKWAIKKQFNLPNDFTSILNKRPDQFHESERECVYGMLIGMAMRKYNYDPNAQRNAATGGKNNSIKVDLEHKGIPIDEETVRFHFNAAYEMHKVRIINKKLTE
ncbi:MAG: hypothetical protein HYX60_04425 [Legionella longbeachae]|nr:hypothetical protein [Legionella longbeachae]